MEIMSKVAIKNPSHDFDTEIYIHGTRDGYQNHLGEINKFFNNSASAINSSRRGITRRYINSFKQKMAMTQTELIKEFNFNSIQEMQQAWSEAITQALGTTTSSKETGDLLTAMQRFVQDMSLSNLQTSVDNMIEALNNFEQNFNKMTPEEKTVFRETLNPSTLEGKIISFDEKDEINFQRLRENIEKIRQYSYVSQAGVVRSINREVGNLNEVIDTWALQKGQSVIEKSLKDKIKINGIKQVGAQMTAKESTGKNHAVSGKAKPDSVIEYSLNGNSDKLELGISYKVSSNLAQGWQNAGRAPNKYVQIFTTVKAYELLLQVFGKTPASENSILNTLVWSTAGSKNYKMIQRGLISKFFDQFLAGSGARLSGGNIDLADVLVINGIGIPVINIIQQVQNNLLTNEKAFTKSGGIVQANLAFKNGNRNFSKADIRTAIKNSDNQATAIRQALTLTVKLNAKTLAAAYNNRV